MDGKEEALRERKAAQTSAGLKGLIILFILNIAGYFVFSLLLGAILGAITEIIFLLITLFLVLYFIWGKEDILVTFIDEGYCKIIQVGGKFYKILMNYKGKAFDQEWNIVSEDDPKAKYKDKSFLGLHLIWPLFFGQVYTHYLQWKKYDPNKGIVVSRAELLKQTSVMPYPYYIESKGAEDKNRAPLNLSTVATIKVVNPYKALFNVTTEWIYIVTPRIQSFFVGYIKQYAFQDLIKQKEALGKEIFSAMAQEGFFEEISKYGIEIVSIDVIDITGGDKEIEAAIKANALAQLQKEATITSASAQAEKIKIIADAEAHRRATAAQTFMDMLSARTGLSPQEIAAEQEADPVAFESKYGDIIKQCNDTVTQMISADAGALIHILSAGGAGGGSGSSNSGGSNINTDLIATVIALLKAMNMPVNNINNNKTAAEREESNLGQQKQKNDNTTKNLKKYKGE